MRQRAHRKQTKTLRAPARTLWRQRPPAATAAPSRQIRIRWLSKARSRSRTSGAVAGRTAGQEQALAGRAGEAAPAAATPQMSVASTTSTVAPVGEVEDQHQPAARRGEAASRPSSLIATLPA